ncbi:MAG: hypothetical protein KA229_02470 [Chitinophagaceae bacterium]|nr:hypothetical protein [Chitinophagaceae bacterium]
MKKLLLFFLILGTISIHAQSQNWLLASEIYQGPDGILKWQYSYTTQGQISKVLYTQSKKLFYTESDFKTDNNNRVISFTRTYANGKTPTETVAFEYNTKGELSKFTTNIIKDGKPKTTILKEYEWATDSVIVYSGGKTNGYTKTIHLLNNHNDITKVKFLDMKNTETSDAFVFAKYDNNPNPYTLRGNYPDDDINAAHNKTTFFMSRNATATYTYNKNGLPVTSKINFYFPETKQTITHQITYSYLPLKP